jgi:prolyl-tRNA editing enzyme YbaK/EbsC (Cys-tRNA(Pro) deacylase)
VASRTWPGLPAVHRRVRESIAVRTTPRTQPALERPDLLAEPVAAALRARPELAAQVTVAEIDPDLADTAAFCESYGVGLDESANCVVIAAKRAGTVTLAACMVLATSRADVNGVARRLLEARKASFAPMGTAVSETGMRYGGITPIGLPAGWPILVDSAVATHPRVVVGAGVRHAKLWLPGAALADLPGARVVDGLGVPV